MASNLKPVKGFAQKFFQKYEKMFWFGISIYSSKETKDIIIISQMDCGVNSNFESYSQLGFLKVSFIIMAISMGQSDILPN